MNKKSVIICICAALVLLSFVGAGVAMLYSDRDEAQKQDEVAQLPEILHAIPSDAAVVLSFQSAKSGVPVLADRSQLLHILATTNRSFFSLLRHMDDSLSLKSLPMAVSLHHAGTLDPLMVLDAGSSADTTDYQRKLLSAADELQLAASLVRAGSRSLLLISPSETLVESSLRHIDGGASVLDVDSFGRAAAHVPSKDVLYFSNAYAGKLISTFCAKTLFPHSTFIKNYAEWTVFGIEDASRKHLLMPGYAVCGKNASHFANVLGSLEPGESRFAQVAPSACIFAVDVAVADFDAYYRSYERYLDASMSLQKHHRRLDTLAAHTGADPVKWMKELGVQEVAKVLWPESETLFEATMMRVSRQHRADRDAEAFEYGDFAGEVFGPVFGCAEATHCLRRGEWMIVGSEAALASLNAGKSSLQDALSNISESHILPQKGVRAVVWFSAGEDPGRLGSWFKSATVSELRATLDGAACEPVVLTVGAEGMSLESVRPSAPASSRQKDGRVAVAAGVEVPVPEGPFEVVNCGTGKTNLFYQNSSLSLCLKDKETGKGIWGVPFDKPVCGAVACIDYLANNKIQFLFGAGSSIYLIDRLGRFVSGFPVDLGKEILIGPDAYDFSGAKGYTVIVLHTDNTIGMYDIHGKAPSSWKGIAPAETILSLPGCVNSDGHRYWTVETSGGRLVYDFMGGEPLKGKALKNLNL